MVPYLILIFLSDNTPNLDKVNLRIYIYLIFTLIYLLKTGWFDMGSATWKVPVTRSQKTTTLSSLFIQDYNLSYWTIGLLNNDQCVLNFHMPECRYHHGWMYRCTYSYVEVGSFQITESEGLD